MTTLEIFYLAAIVSTFVVLRFGAPLLVTWAIGQMLERMRHHPS